METDRNIYIKNMVCDRCVMVVRSVLERLGLTPLSVELGRAELSAPLAETARQALREALAPLGFELIDDPRIRTVEHIKRSHHRTRAPTGQPPADKSVAIPRHGVPPRLRYAQQAVLRNARHDHRKILYRPENRTCQGTVGLR